MPSLLGSRLLGGARVALGLGLLGGAFALHSRSAEAALPAPVAPRLSLLGATLDPNASPREAAETAAKRYLDGTITLTIGTESRSMTREQLGARVDVDMLEAEIAAARDPSSRLYALRAAHGLPDDPTLHLPVRFDPEPARALLLAAKPALDRPTRSARYDLATKAVTPGEEGRLLDVYASLQAIHEALADEETAVVATVRRTAPPRTAADLAEVRPDTQISAFETRYSMLESARDRTNNLHVAAERIDGMVLLPGETFDFNEVVGPRSQANGFRNATVIAGGELSEDVGGGACQISGTLHAAALFAGLEILERRPHSRPSSYIKLGLDAMVNYPTVNLRFRNDLRHPVLLHVTVGRGTVRVEVLGSEQPRLVTFVRRVDDFIPYTEVLREDPSLPEGARVLDQRGVAGFRISRFRLVRDLAKNQAVRTRSADVYPPTSQIWRVGTGAPAPEGYIAPVGDTHGEYRADGYLEMTQGAGVEGIVERRVLGRTGIVGWTATAGMPQPPATEGPDEAP